MFPSRNLKEMDHLILTNPEYGFKSVDFEWPRKVTYNLFQEDMDKFMKFNKAEQVNYMESRK